MVRASLLVLTVAGAFSSARAMPTVSASLFEIQASPGAVTTPVLLSGVTPTPSTATIYGAGFTVTFNGLSSGQGVVRGASSGNYAIPVAGATGQGNATAQYLTGDFGSALTTNAAASGNYLSTGGPGGTITITFATAVSSIAVLWGSIDTTNRVAFNDAAGDIVTGAQVQAAAANFVSNGYQGPGGSAYVAINTATPFTTATFSSDVVSFEFAAIEGSTKPFTAVPEPMSLALLGTAFVGTGLITRRRRQP